jgi:ABC-type multidrug transport system ATPase subunit
MEIVVEPDVYMPSIDEQGNYIDRVCVFKKGVTCLCGSRKDKVYETQSMFSSHVKTKTHQRWLHDLNTNKANYYVENEKMKEVVQNQRLIIAKMEKDLQNKMMTIDYLTMQLNKTCPIVSSLLDFD